MKLPALFLILLALILPGCASLNSGPNYSARQL